jgi:hypothetical protein
MLYFCRRSIYGPRNAAAIENCVPARVEMVPGKVVVGFLELIARIRNHLTVETPSYSFVSRLHELHSGNHSSLA